MASVSEDELKRFIADVFMRRGAARIDAETIADALVWANLRGVDSHGVVRLPRYMELIDEGLMNVTPAMSVEGRAAAGLTVHADRAPGPVAMALALDEVIARAKQQGVALALVSRMTHSGALGYYTLKAAQAGMACLALNATIPLMPYHGAGGAAIGTNPLSIAVPGGEGADPLVFDMATSVVSLGKLLQARRNGTPLQPGRFVDGAGHPTTDPATASMTLPLGGPKGSGLSLMIECLTSLLVGNSIIADALDKTGEGGKHRQNALLLAIDVSAFVALAAFRDQVQRLVTVLKALSLAPGSETILMPGERGFRAMAERLSVGVPLPPAVLKELTAIAGRLDVSPLQMMS
jgi:ureidoglycolate dehydrogenase (NAD+)